MAAASMPEGEEEDHARGRGGSRLGFFDLLSLSLPDFQEFLEEEKKGKMLRTQAAPDKQTKNTASMNGLGERERDRKRKTL